MQLMNIGGKIRKKWCSDKTSQVLHRIISSTFSSIWRKELKS